MTVSAPCRELKGPWALLKTSSRWALFLALSGLLACGANSNAAGGSCGKVQPCGGAIMGSWKFSSGCDFSSISFDGTDVGNACPAASATLSNLRGTARVTYGADQTYSQSGNLSADMHLDVPLSCFAVGKTCAGLDAYYVMQMQTSVDPKFTSAACATSGTNCHCELSLVSDVSEDGVYTTDQSTLTTTPLGGTSTQDSYCVQDNELHDITLDMTMPMGPMGMAKISADVVLAKE